MPHRLRQPASLCAAVRERATDADGAEGFEPVGVLDDGELGEAAEGAEVDGRVLGFGCVGDGGADYGDGDGDVGGPAEGEEVRFDGWGGGDGRLGREGQLGIRGGGKGKGGGEGGGRRLAVLVVVDVVHEGHELRDCLVELDVLELLLLDAEDLHAQRQDPLHVPVVVRGVKVSLRHVRSDEVARPAQQLPHHGPAGRLHRVRSASLLQRPLGRRPLLRVRDDVPGLVARERLHPEAALVARLDDALGLPAEAADGAPHCALVDERAAGTLEEPAHVFYVGVGAVGEVEAQAGLVVRGDFGGAPGADGALFFGQPDFAAVVVELLHGAGFFVGDGVRGHDGFDVVAGG